MIGLVFAAALQTFARVPLASALSAALDASPDVVAARDRVRENAALLAAAKHAASPALLANYTEAPQGGTNNDTIAQRLFTLGAQVTTLDYAARQPAIAAAGAQLKQAQLDELAAERTERVKTLGLYYDSLRAVATARIRAQALRQARADESAARKRYAAGDAPRLDIIRAQVAVAQAQADSAQADVDRENALEALAVETAVPRDNFAVLAQTSVPSPLAPDITRTVEAALSRRSDIASARANVDAERALVSGARRAGVPGFTLTAGYTRGIDGGVLVHGPTATVQMLFSLSHVAADRATAEAARLDQAQVRVDGLVRQVRLDVAAAVRSYEAARANRAAAARAVAGAQAQLRATETGYRNGAASSLDVSDARRTFVQAQLTELGATYAQAKSQALLAEEIGT